MDITQDHPDWRYASGQGLGKRALSKHGTLLAPPYLYQSRSSLNLSTSTSMYSSIQKLSEPHTLKGFLEASTHRYDRSLTPFLPFSLLKKMGGGRAENSKLLFMAWSLWWPALIQKPTQSHLIGTKTLLSPRKIQGFQEPCVGTQGQRLTARTKDVPSALIILEISRVLKALCQKQRPNTYLFL